MKYQIEQEWLEARYISDLATVGDIAGEIGCTVANIRRLLKKWGICRGKTIQKLGIVPAWNKGLTKHDDERLMKISEDHRGDGNPMSGKVAWNSGLTKDTDERVAAISDALKGRDISEETRERMSEVKVGLVGGLANNWRGGKSYSNGYGVHRRTIGGKRKYAHRHVAETELGRPLLECEHVHHLDRNKTNNHPSNLIVLHADDHNRLHRAIDTGHESSIGQRAWLVSNNIEYLELKKNED